MNGHVFQQVGLLSEGFTTVLTPKGLFPGVGPQVNLDVGLVEEASVAYLTVVHHLLALVTLASGPPSANTSSVSLVSAAAKQTLKVRIGKQTDLCSIPH